MAAETLGNASLVLDKLAANDGVSDLCADGLGYMGVASTFFGADAKPKLGLDAAALGAQPDPYDTFRPRATPVALRVEEARSRLQIRPARAGQKRADLPMERSILGQCHLHAPVRCHDLDAL